ncbi:MAG: helix-turn-helix transcriptional regulator [Clostridia bacterium]|nr:helix-turn-helix transcriptional regulator [Clostridia bacterium]
MEELLHYFPPNIIHTLFYISLAGVTYPNPHYRIDQKFRNISVLEYVTSGKGYVLANGMIHEVGPDTIYFLRKGESHLYFSDTKDPFTKIFLNISGALSNLLSSMYNLEGVYFFNCTELRTTFEKIPEILHYDVNEIEKQIALQGVLVEILARLSYENAKNSYDSEANQLKSYIDSHPERLVSNSELASIIYRSPDYCQKLFRREFFDTPYAYQLKQKMIKAKYLLSNTQMPIGEIGKMLGYEDAQYFSNLFQSKCGCRPSAYRKNEKSTV